MQLERLCFLSFPSGIPSIAFGLPTEFDQERLKPGAITIRSGIGPA